MNPSRWPTLMYSTRTQVICYTLLQLASATAVATDVRSAPRRIVWLLPETRDTFQTTVGCISSGHFRQISNIVQFSAEEVTANAYSDTDACLQVQGGCKGAAQQSWWQPIMYPMFCLHLICLQYYRLESLINPV